MAAPMTNVLTTVFQLFSLPENESDVRLSHLLSVIQSNKILSQQKPAGIQDLLSYMHHNLSSSKNRRVSVALLGQVVAQCSTEVFQQSALTWTTLLLQVLQGHCQVPVYEASCQILTQIFYFAKNFVDISREIISSVIPQLVPLLLTASAKVKSSAIACLNSIIRTYPGPLGPFKKKIEACVLSAIDVGSNDKELFQCFSLMPQLGPGGSLGIKHAEAWLLLCQQVLRSLESTLGRLYDGLETESTKAVEGRQHLPLTPIDPDQPGSVTCLVSRFLCLTACLQELLSEGLETAVKVPLEEILQLVCRCLTVNCKVLLSRPSMERVLLAGHLTGIHVGAWNVLKQLIVGCKSVLLPHYSVIVGLLSQELIWTATETTGHTIQYSELRETVYQVMTLWLKTLDGNSGIHGVDKSFVRQILQDCLPVTETLKMAGYPQDSTDHTSKKKKHKGYQEISQGISSQRKLHHYGNQTLVAAGLEAMYWMVLTSGGETDKQVLQDLQSFSVRTLLSLQQAVHYPVPYISVECRQNLYRVLHACTMTTHAAVPPPTQCAYGIFRAGLQDKSLEVSSFCIEALKTCELLIHPRAPCLNGPVICENLVHISCNMESVPKTSTDSNATGIGHVKETEVHVSDFTDISNNVKHHKQVGAKSGTTSCRKRSSADETDPKAVVEVKQAKFSTDTDSSASTSKLQPIDGERGKDDSGTDGELSDQDMDDSKLILEISSDIDDNVIETYDSKDEILNSTAGSSEVYVATKLDIDTSTGDAGDVEEEDVDLLDGEGEVVELTSDSEEPEAVEISQTPDKKDNQEVDTVLMTFVDAEPDSD